MDDGSYSGGKERNLVISTDGFKKEETLLLVDILKKKYQIDCAESYIKAKDHWRIYIPRRLFEKFESIVLPYILPCFMYKLNTI